MSLRQRVALCVYALAAIANVIATAVHGNLLDHVSKPWLMPMLALVVWFAAPPPASRALIIAGLLSATAGDVALMGSSTPAFLIGMVFFLGCHGCYIAAFARNGAVARLRANRRAAYAYGLVLVVALAVLWVPLGGLAAPIAVYALALFTMATLASTFGPRIGVGGGLFLVSDMLIAVGIGGAGFAGREILVMITYVIGQLLIVTSWVSRPNTGENLEIPATRIAYSRN
ncbi:MAG TPA: lysoplasmalogenase [Micromonosporaceae bacterium]